MVVNHVMFNVNRSSLRCYHRLVVYAIVARMQPSSQPYLHHGMNVKTTTMMNFETIISKQ